MTQALTPAALANADLLRALDAPLPPADLLTFGGRRKDNVQTTLTRMEDDGLLSRGCDGDATPRLTDAGRLAVRALDLAEGRFAVPQNALLVRHDQLVPHPDNPRKTVAAEPLASLADTIEAEGDVLEQLVVGRAGGAPDGRRYVYIGERRWRAIGLMIADGRWPLDRPLKAEERDDEPGLIFSLSLVENGQREPLTELERARAFHALGQSRNWKAPQIAKHTGYELRTVQQSLQVVDKATDEALAAYGEDGNWERLRASVQEKRPKPSLDLTPKMALPLVELAYSIDSREIAGAERTQITTPAPGGAWHTLLDRGLVKPVFVGDGKMYAALGAAVRPWLSEIGYEADAAEAVRKAREAVIGALETSALQPDEMATDWLNAPPAKPAAPSERSHTDTLVAEGRARAPLAGGEPEDEAEQGEGDAKVDANVQHYAEMKGQTLEAHTPAAAQPSPPAPPLSRDLAVKLDPDEALILIEVAHALRHRPVAAPGRGFHGAEATSAYRDDRAASKLVMEHRVLGFVTGPRNGWLAYPQKAGWTWLQAHGLASGEMSAVGDGEWRMAMTTAGTADTMAAEMVGQGVYATDWLRRPEPAADAPTPAAPAATPAQTPAEKTDTPTPVAEPTPAQSEAEMILAQVRGSTSTLPNVLQDLFRAAGVTGPLTVENEYVLDGTGAVVATIDAADELPEGLARARAELIARAVNAAVAWTGGAA